MNCQCAKCAPESRNETLPAGPSYNAIPTDVIDRGEGLYQTFNGFESSRVERVRYSRVIPPVVVQLGELVGLIYRSDKRNPGQPLTYIHYMEDTPRLVCNIQGTQLYVVGGSYRVTEQGIEG